MFGNRPYPKEKVNFLVSSGKEAVVQLGVGSPDAGTEVRLLPFRRNRELGHYRPSCLHCRDRVLGRARMMQGEDLHLKGTKKGFIIKFSKKRSGAIV